MSSYIPVVSGRIGSMLLDLGLAGGIEGGLLQVLLQAANHLGVSMLHVLAECLQSRLQQSQCSSLQDFG
jgi:hypothetical protein